MAIVSKPLQQIEELIAPALRRSQAIDAIDIGHGSLAAVPALARANGETRSMAALKLWEPYLTGSVVLIGNAPTALFRLLEMIRDNEEQPALIIAMPVGFIGAAESKQLLWDSHRELGVDCITLLGREGGSAVTAASCNALLRCINDEWY